MTKIIGFLLGVSFQTELLIMTLLGLANSTLDWKPFELVPRLNLIRDLNFSNNDGIQFGNSSTSWIKRLLSITVVTEFFCSLLNPFAYLLKLYPILTWSRSKILLPWLITHALNTILPKMLSVSLAFVFYRANKISTMSLIEFMIVESINLVIATYNWYVFFAFYLDLREVDRKRDLRRSREKMILDSDSSPRVYSSIPNMGRILCESSTESNCLLISKSFASLIDNESSSDTMTPNNSIDENLPQFERTLKILNLTPEDYRTIQATKRDILTSTIFGKLISEFQDSALLNLEDNDESDSSMDRSRNSCSCSSSDNGNTMTMISRKTQSHGDNNDDEAQISSSSGVEIQRKTKPEMRIKKKIDKLTQANIQMPLSTHVSSPFEIGDLKNDHQNLHFLLSQNIEVLNQICRTMMGKRISSPNSSTEKWLMFQHELECNLDRNIFSKRSNIVENLRYDNINCNYFETASKRNDVISYDGMNLSKQESDSRNWYYTDDRYYRPYPKIYVESTEQLEENDKSKARYSPLYNFKEAIRINSPSFQTPGVHSTSTRNYVNRVQLKKSVYRMSKSRYSKSSNTGKWVEYKKYRRRKESDIFSDCRNISSDDSVYPLLRRRNSEVDHQENSNDEEFGHIQNFDESIGNRNVEDVILDDSVDIVKSNLPKKEITTTKKVTIPTELEKNQLNIKEIISKIDWNVNSNTNYRSRSVRNIKNQRSNQLENNFDQHNPIEDEDLHMLRSAFSFSDQSQRGYHLGPESRGPYPIFQTVDLSITDIFKATGWRSLGGILNPVSENENHLSETREPIVCGTEANDNYFSESVNVNDIVRTSRNFNGNRADEIVQKRTISASLVRHLQELLESSRETLSAIENRVHRIPMEESR